MQDLRQHLQRFLDGSLCLVGLGAADRGDDAFGVRLVTALETPAPDSAPAQPIAQTLVAGLALESHLGALTASSLDHILFVDAVDFGAPPGSVVFLDSAALDQRYPQVSTHKLSLSLMARWLAGNGRTRTWLLGAQPESVRPSPRLSATLDATCAALEAVLGTLWTFQPWRPALVATSGEQRQVPQEASC